MFFSKISLLFPPNSSVIIPCFFMSLKCCLAALPSISYLSSFLISLDFWYLLDQIWPMMPYHGHPSTDSLTVDFTQPLERLFWRRKFVFLFILLKKSFTSLTFPLMSLFFVFRFLTNFLFIYFQKDTLGNCMITCPWWGSTGNLFFILSVRRKIEIQNWWCFSPCDCSVFSDALVKEILNVF